MWKVLTNVIGGMLLILLAASIVWTYRNPGKANPIVALFQRKEAPPLVVAQRVAPDVRLQAEKAVAVAPTPAPPASVEAAPATPVPAPVVITAKKPAPRPKPVVQRRVAPAPRERVVVFVPCNCPNVEERRAAARRTSHEEEERPARKVSRPKTKSSHHHGKLGKLKHFFTFGKK